MEKICQLLALPFAIQGMSMTDAGVVLALLNLTCYLKGGLVLKNPLLSFRGLRAPFHNFFAVKINVKLQNKG